MSCVLAQTELSKGADSLLSQLMAALACPAGLMINISCLTSCVLVQAELSKGSDSLLSKVMAAFARPTRLCNSQKIDVSTDVNAQLFELEEERQLQMAFQQVASKVRQQVLQFSSFGKFDMSMQHSRHVGARQCMHKMACS